MKNSRSLAVLLLVPLATACPVDPEADDGQAGESGESSDDGELGDCGELTDSLVMIRSCEPHDQDPQLDPEQSAALAAGNLAFAVDLYHALRDEDAEGKGFLISPYSLQAAFGLLYGGTVGPARAELESTLHFSLGDEQHEAFNWLDAQLAARNLPEIDGADPVIVQTANGAWILDALATAVEPNFLDLLSIHHDTGMGLADFAGQPQLERSKINAWVAERTNDLIPELFAEGVIAANTKFVLVNALYLKAPWLTPFDPELTAPGTFTGLDDSAVEVPMMFQEIMGRLESGDGWTALTVPLRGEALEFIVIVPDDFAAFEASLDADLLDTILLGNQEGWVSVQLSLPRFELGSQLDLVDEMQALGMPTPFQTYDSFAGIVDPELQLIGLGPVVQHTVLEVHEGGLEAAAASGIVGLGPPSFPPYFAADRPFLLAIYDRPTNTLLFFGRVLDPTAD